MRGRRLFARVLGYIPGALVFALLTLAVVIFVVPRILGGTSLTILTGSMEPTINPGDVVAIKPYMDSTEVRTGDIVTFQPISGDPTLVTHRIIGMLSSIDGSPGYVTRGDANSGQDDPIVFDQIAGKVMYAVPAVGHLIMPAATQGIWAVPLVVCGLVLYAAWQFAPRRRHAVEP